MFNDGKVKGIYNADNLLYRKLDALGLSWKIEVSVAEGRINNHRIWSYGRMAKVIECNHIDFWLPKMLDLSKIKDEKLKARFIYVIRGDYTKENRLLALKGLIETTQKSLKHRKLHDVQYY
jgi:hypothetical protein